MVLRKHGRRADEVAYMCVRFSWFGAGGLPVEVFGGQKWLQRRLYGPSVLTIRARMRPDPRSGRAVGAGGLHSFGWQTRCRRSVLRTFLLTACHITLTLESTNTGRRWSGW